MKSIKTLRAAVAVLLTLTLCAQGLPSASAVSGTYDAVKNQDCTLTVEYAPEDKPMANNTFRIWRVGTLSEQGCIPLDEIAAYHVLNGEGTWLDKASTLLSYLQRDSVPPTASAATGEDGKVTFSIPAADQGLYLVAGDSQSRGETRYTPTPFLIMVPYSQDLRTWETTVETYSKFTTNTPTDPGRPEQPEPLQRHVLKSWNDSGHEDERPEEIVVDLLRDGQVYDTVTLTAANSWRFDWTDLDPQYTWTVAERENGRYSVLVEQEGITFHITNTWQEDPDNPPPTIDIPDEEPPLDNTEIPDENPPLDSTDIPDENPPLDTTDIPDEEPPLDGDPKLPQTGQLWWPVAPMVLGGLVLIALGWKRRRDWSASNET